MTARVCVDQPVVHEPSGLPAQGQGDRADFGSVSGVDITAEPITAGKRSAVRGNVTPPPASPPVRAEDTQLRHGYSLAGIDKLTMLAVFKDFWHQGMDIGDRRELAWSAIVERLYERQDVPTRHDLISAAQSVISEAVRTDLSTRGISKQNKYGEMPNFWRFWLWHTQPTLGPEELVIDKMALWQIWDELAPRYQRALLALATHDDHNKAAAALGITRSMYNKDLSAARKAFFRLWHEGETPSRLWAHDHRGYKGTDNHTIMSSIVRRRKKPLASQCGQLREVEQ